MTNVTNWDAGDPHLPAGFETWGQAISEDVDAAATGLAGKVGLTGDQTVAGVKTFSSSPIVPAPTTDLQAATKKYVDDKGGGGGTSDHDAEQNVRLWELEASLLGTAEGFAGWQGDGFLTGQDEVSADGGLAVSRAVRLPDGSVGMPAGSPDTWTSRTTPGTGIMLGVASSGTLFVAVGDSGVIWTSPDGTTWTSRTTPGTDNMRGVAWSGTLFVAVGLGGAVWTSPDGTTWTSRTTPGTDSMRGVTSSGTLFVAVGNGGVVWTSPDGTTWTSRTTPGTDNMFGVTSSGTLFVAVGNGGAVWTSPAGTADTGTLVLNTVTLPATATDVYLLTEETLDATVTATYEATLDGGTTWETVTSGTTVTLGHSGTSFALRVTLERPTDSTAEGRVFWLIGYAS